MITEDYVSFEVAKLLKEKGFDEPCTTRYGTDKRFIRSLSHFKNSEINKDAVNVPTLQMTMRWLREVHQLHISVDVRPIYGKVKDEKGRNTCGLLYWHYIASGEWMNDKREPQQKAFVVSEKTYEEAVEAAIKYCLKNLI